MNRRRIVSLAVGAAVLTGAIVVLRSGVEPPVSGVVGPDGERITAFHDAALVSRPEAPEGRPRRPGQLHTDPRWAGALVSWPPAPYGFEVRWGRVGGKLDSVRYVATPSITLRDLPPGRYRVEVRSVDEVGRRSDPTGADVEVGAGPPQWQQGLGFVEDFTGGGGGLNGNRWRVSQHMRQHLRREGYSGPVLLDGRNGGHLRPVSPLELTDPDQAGVRGRIVVVADMPTSPVPEPPPGAPPESGPPANELVVSVNAPGPIREAAIGVYLRITSQGVFIIIGNSRVDMPPSEHRLDVATSASPGVAHRWDLIFTTDHVQVHRDGVAVGEVEFRPAWRKAEVSLAAFVPTETLGPSAVRVALVGLTGPTPDDRPVEVVEVNRDTDVPAREQRVAIPGARTVERARLTGLLVNPGPGTHLDLPPPPPEVVAEVGGRPLELVKQFSENAGPAAFWFSAELPVDLTRGETTVVLRSSNGAEFAAYAMELELTHAPRTALEVWQPRVERPRQPETALPRLVVRNGGQDLISGAPTPRSKLDVEVVLDAAAAQAVAGELVGWVALRAELGNRRILDFPTAINGPAIAGGFRFTLDTTTLPPGQHVLAVSLIPDRPAVAHGIDRFVLKLEG